MRLLLPAPPGFSFRRSAFSHGWYDLAPFTAAEKGDWVSTVVAMPGGGARRIVLHDSGRHAVTLETPGAPKASERRVLAAAGRRIMGLDLALTDFHEVVSTQPRYAWIARSGTGRLLRAPTMFEDVVKLVLTTNCSWSATKRMNSVLVEKYGEIAPDGSRSFPMPERLAKVRETTWRTAVRAGYRAPLLASLSRQVASGKIDLDAWDKDERPTEQLKKDMLALPGVGPYVAENLLKYMARPQGLALDSWVRAKYAKLHHGGRKISDRTIQRGTAALGPWAGLALWFEMTRDWFEGDEPHSGWTTVL